jgi:tRNA wybutosine-synthesizing protein 1
MCINAHRELVSGYKGDPRCDLTLWEESRNPNQVAISLSGEPTLYPYLDEFIRLCKNRGMTTFLVTNGTQPKTLENLSCMPTQLYVSVVAPSPEIYKKLCRPAISNSWSSLKRTLELLSSLNTITVIRHTLIQDWNLGFEEEYAKLDKLAEPTYIEPKGYMFVGYSRKRLNISNMPKHLKIRQFAEKLAFLLDYKLVGERVDSRVVLLRKD